MAWIFPALARSTRIPLHQLRTSLFPDCFYFFFFRGRGRGKEATLRQTYMLAVRTCQSKCLSAWYIVDSVSKGMPFALAVLRGCDYTVKRMYHSLVLFFFGVQLVAFLLTHRWSRCVCIIREDIIRLGSVHVAS